MTRESETTPLADAMWEELEQRLAVRGGPMRVLFATDGSKPADDGLALLKLLPLPPGSAVQVVTVLESGSWLAPASLLSSEQEAAAVAGEKAQGQLAREGLKIGCAVSTGSPAPEILRAAVSFRADLIVVGSHGRTGIPGFLIGSVARNVAKHAACSVLVARSPRHGLQRAIVAVDESRHAPDVLQAAMHFPLPEATELQVCHVVRPYGVYPVAGMEFGAELDLMVNEVNEQSLARGYALVGEIGQRLERAGHRVSTGVRRGDPAHEIISLAREQEADLVIAGARGISPIEGLLLGSVADRLLNGAPCSLLLVHPRAHS